MRIRLEHNGTVFEFERRPMEIGRFTVLCKLAGAVIGGAVLVALVRMLPAPPCKTFDLCKEGQI